MVFTGKFSAEKRAYIRLLGKTWKYTAKVADECKVSLPSVYKIWNEKFRKGFSSKEQKQELWGQT